MMFYLFLRGKTIHTEQHSKGAMGKRISEGNISMMNLTDEKSFNKIAESAGICLSKSFVIQLAQVF